MLAPYIILVAGDREQDMMKIKNSGTGMLNQPEKNVQGTRPTTSRNDGHSNNHDTVEIAVNTEAAGRSDYHRGESLYIWPVGDGFEAFDYHSAYDNNSYPDLRTKIDVAASTFPILSSREVVAINGEPPRHASSGA